MRLEHRIDGDGSSGSGGGGGGGDGGCGSNGIPYSNRKDTSINVQ